jgi:hypothetical protein
MMAELEDRINKKIDKVAQELRGQQTRDQQSQATSSKPSDIVGNAEIVRKCLEVLESVRQASQGNVAALMDLVKR